MYSIFEDTDPQYENQSKEPFENDYVGKNSISNNSWHFYDILWFQISLQVLFYLILTVSLEEGGTSFIIPILSIKKSETERN